MLKTINPTQTKSWSKLTKHFQEFKDVQMKDLFSEDANRFTKYSVQLEDFVVDYSKNRINQKTLDLLMELARECDLEDGINRMFTGDTINANEQRSVLHTAIRQPNGNPVFVDGENIIPQIRDVQAQMKAFADRFHSKDILGYSGKPLQTIVNIGIGGSDLGPVMVTEALRPYWKEGVDVHFVSNVDGTHISEVLKKIDPETTLFIIASKTFTTQETMTNAHTARNWFLENGGRQTHIKNHFIALSTNTNAVLEFGIARNNMFEFWDWVGGRFSLTSAIGMSIALTIGYDNFEELLAGFGAMDDHFRVTEFESNIPVLLALIGIWYVNFFDAHTEAILPYDQYLHRFPAYFQQANMESNGKSVDRNGDTVDYQTGPIVWGEPGTNGQHAFYQLIHQGTKLIPCDFIATAISNNPISDHHPKLLANFFAQSEALMNGKTKDQVIEEFEKQNTNPKDYESIVPFKVFKGNNPSNSILINQLTPYSLGQLVAMYEHKIFVQGYIWNIFSFDQWGVELGKQLAKNILPKLKSDKPVSSHDASTNGLINVYKKMRTNI